MPSRSLLEHVLDGRLVLRPAGAIAEILISQFPSLHRVEEPISETAYLLVRRDMQEQLDQAHSRVRKRIIVRIAVVFDLVNPAPSGRRLRNEGREIGLMKPSDNEAERSISARCRGAARYSKDVERWRNVIASVPPPPSNDNTNGTLPVRPLREGAANFSIYQPPKPIPKFTTGAPYPKPPYPP
jgi:hypothetical protein